MEFVSQMPVNESQLMERRGGAGMLTMLKAWSTPNTGREERGEGKSGRGEEEMMGGGRGG